MPFPHTKRVIATWLIGGLMVVVMSLCGLVSLVIAVFFAVETLMPSGAAALLTACAAFAVAGLAAHLTFARRRRLAAPLADGGRPAPRPAGLGDSLAADLHGVIGRHPHRAALAALALGVVLGVSPASRGLLLRLLDRASARI